jgi:hypothetical protein
MHRSGLGQIIWGSGFSLKRFGQPEVQYLRLSTLSDDDVGRLDITMDDAL